MTNYVLGSTRTQSLELQLLCLYCCCRRGSWGRRIWSVCDGKAWGWSENGPQTRMVATNGSSAAGWNEARAGGNPSGKKAVKATRTHTHSRRDLEADASPPRNRE